MRKKILYLFTVTMVLSLICGLRASLYKNEEATAAMAGLSISI